MSGTRSEEPGAISARGVTEYQFNLNLAKAIEQKLTAAGFGTDDDAGDVRPGHDRD